MKATPGPWAFGRTLEEGEVMIVGAEPHRKYVCTVYLNQTNPMYSAFDNPERKANARLISAAPDLLEALEEFVANIDAINLILGRNPTGAAILEKARAAIARAKGEA